MPPCSSHGGLSGITRSFPRLSRTRGYVPMPYYPVCRSSISRRRLVARLACLIHAANVHSEPGSNPSIDSKDSGQTPATRIRGRPRTPDAETDVSCENREFDRVSSTRITFFSQDFTNQIAKDLSPRPRCDQASLSSLCRHRPPRWSRFRRPGSGPDSAKKPPQRAACKGQ